MDEAQKWVEDYDFRTAGILPAGTKVLEMRPTLYPEVGVWIITERDGKIQAPLFFSSHSKGLSIMIGDRQRPEDSE